MTREEKEALELLKYNSNVIHRTIHGETDHKEVEALDMAIKYSIKYLEQESMLDKIRAEIMQVANQEKFHDEKWALGLIHAVKIIDKYIEESGSEK